MLTSTTEPGENAEKTSPGAPNTAAKVRSACSPKSHISDQDSLAQCLMQGETMIESDFAQYYSEESFCEKVSDYVLASGKDGIRDGLIYYVLALYYTLLDSRQTLPLQVKGVIAGALGYFVFPLDVIPDSIPVAGFTDDLAIVASVMSLIAAHIPPEAKQRANEKLDEWFRRV